MQKQGKLNRQGAHFLKNSSFLSAKRAKGFANWIKLNHFQISNCSGICPPQATALRLSSLPDFDYTTEQTQCSSILHILSLWSDLNLICDTIPTKVSLKPFLSIMASKVEVFFIQICEPSAVSWITVYKPAANNRLQYPINFGNDVLGNSSTSVYWTNSLQLDFLSHF